jgi:two-component system sensor histidine kinase FlrB
VQPSSRTATARTVQGLLWRDIIKVPLIRLDDGHEGVLRMVEGYPSDPTLGTEPGQVILLKDNTETRLLQDRLNHHKRLSALGEMAASLPIRYAPRLPQPALRLHLAKGDLPAAEQPLAEKIVDSFAIWKDCCATSCFSPRRSGRRRSRSDSQPVNQTQQAGSPVAQ